MGRAKTAAVDAYCRELTAQAAFHAGPELSPTAQAVARELVSGRWPAGELWAALHSEFNFAQMMAGAQRPGLIGVEDPRPDDAVSRGVSDVPEGRRHCWRGACGKPADVVYARAGGGGRAAVLGWWFCACAVTGSTTHSWSIAERHDRKRKAK